MKKFLFAACTLLFVSSAIAQQPATSASDVSNALQQKEQLTQNSLVKNLPFKNNSTFI